MTDLPQIVKIVDAMVLPMLAMAILFFSRVSTGTWARFAERQFFIALIVMTCVTLRTVIRCDDLWLIHTMTLGTMIVGALVVQGEPQQNPNYVDANF